MRLARGPGLRESAAGLDHDDQEAEAILNISLRRPMTRRSAPSRGSNIIGRAQITPAPTVIRNVPIAPARITLDDGRREDWATHLPDAWQVGPQRFGVAAE